MLKLDTGVHYMLWDGIFPTSQGLSLVTDVSTNDLWMTFRIVEGEGAQHVNRYLSGKLADTVQNAKLLFVNYDDGSELDLTETDTKDLIFQKLEGKKLKLKKPSLTPLLLNTKL